MNLSSIYFLLWPYIREINFESNAGYTSTIPFSTQYFLKIDIFEHF
jgi:hypothetical protein